jgi:NAD+ diphosphatase
MRIAEQVTFGGSGLERAAHLRADAAAMDLHLAAGRRLVLWRGKPLVRVAAGGAVNLHWLEPDSAVFGGAADPTLSPIFLGLDEAALFAVDLSHWTPPEGLQNAAGSFFDTSLQLHPALVAEEGEALGFQDLRAIMALLTPREAELAAMAKALMEWHRSHRFCAACGQPSAPSHAGWQRTCPACAAQHFPRTDPVVIMLITRDNNLLIGRNAAWPEGMFSLLAGFIEPGETIEAAVRREVFEEAGVRVGAVSYLASQPWPFPASLMIGCRGEAVSEAIHVDPAELEAARWISREEMARAMAGTHPEIRPSRRGAIAQFLIANWIADRLD